MLIRKKFLPKGLHDTAGTLFLAISIPIIYWFEITIVLPETCGIGTFSFYFHSIVGTFLLMNVVGNFLAVILCDTSIKDTIMIPKMSTETQETLWHLCSVCEIMVPPRSWHCRKCKTCILKRDHHCGFTGNCIGHKNHRYFIMLLFYLVISTAYANIFNNWYFWFIRHTDFLSIFSVIKLFFPLAMLVVDQSTEQLYFLIYFLSMIGMIFTLILLLFHLNLILNGTTIHERKNPIYNLGKKKNLKMVFGNRWHLTWISPFIDSPLPNDGFHFDDLIKEYYKGK